MVVFPEVWIPSRQIIVGSPVFNINLGESYTILGCGKTAPLQSIRAIRGLSLSGGRLETT